MTQFDFDLIVIGGGSGGVRAARISAGHGAKVAICEEFRYGGTCVIRGYTEIDRLNGIYGRMLENAGCEVLNGRGELIDKNTVKINDNHYTAERILIATGGQPFMPTIPGIEHAITSNEAFHLDELPESIVIVGGGYIAVEFAGIFNGLGVDTALIYRGDQILRGFDQDIRDHLSAEIQKKGITLKLETDITEISNSKEGHAVTFQDGSKQEFSQVMYATGRTPNSENLGLESIGVNLGKKGEIVVNESSQTNIENIYAVGDVTDRIALTPVATMEGHAFADSLFGNNPRVPDHTNVPSAVFSQPPVASVGLSEEQAKEQFSTVDTYKSEFRTLKHSITDNTERTLMKLIVDADSDKVIGAHMAGADAAEIINSQ